MSKAPRQKDEETFMEIKEAKKNSCREKKMEKSRVKQKG